MHMKKAVKKEKEKDVVACRKSCKAKGTGLSHYILMDRKAKKS
jgi:modified peptide precursor CbpA